MSDGSYKDLIEDGEDLANRLEEASKAGEYPEELDLDAKEFFLRARDLIKDTAVGGSDSPLYQKAERIRKQKPVRVHRSSKSPAEKAGSEARRMKGKVEDMINLLETSRERAS